MPSRVSSAGPDDEMFFIRLVALLKKRDVCVCVCV